MLLVMGAITILFLRVVFLSSYGLNNIILITPDL
jgi:hypothetical protein